MTHDRGLPGERVQRSGPQESDPDLETEIEDQLQSSGRSGVMPREGLVGAHTERREGPAGEIAEPVGAGADVAPTRKAEARERERHRITRAYDVDLWKDRDRAGAEADRRIAEQHLTAEGTPDRWTDRAIAWLRANPQYAVGACASLAAAGLGSFLVLRRSS
jgi:hypothetical protein